MVKKKNGLAAPLHASALVAAPAAIALASTRESDASIDWTLALFVLTAALVVMSLATVSPMFAIGAAVSAGAGLLLGRRDRRSAHDMVRELGGAFFFQAEDGIRDVAVTGVQTCALPI